MKEEINEITYSIIGCAYKVHRTLGPGLLKSTYEACLKEELILSGLIVRSQVGVPVFYNQKKLEIGYRIDLLVEEKVVLEIKAVDLIAPIHKAQILTYLKLAGYKIGLLINFNEINLQNGITRIIM
ncbi:MAG: GxxExxY protein [Bacteroidota bacterium]